MAMSRNSTCLHVSTDCITKISGLDGCIEVQSLSPQGGAGGGSTLLSDETVDIDDVAFHGAFGSSSHCSPGGTIIPGS